MYAQLLLDDKVLTFQGDEDRTTFIRLLGALISERSDNVDSICEPLIATFAEEVQYDRVWKKGRQGFNEIACQSGFADTSPPVDQQVTLLGFRITRTPISELGHIESPV